MHTNFVHGKFPSSRNNIIFFYFAFDLSFFVRIAEFFGGTVSKSIWTTFSPLFALGHYCPNNSLTHCSRTVPVYGTYICVTNTQRNRVPIVLYGKRRCLSHMHYIFIHSIRFGSFSYIWCVCVCLLGHYLDLNGAYPFILLLYMASARQAFWGRQQQQRQQRQQRCRGVHRTRLDHPLFLSRSLSLSFHLMFMSLLLLWFVVAVWCVLLRSFDAPTHSLALFLSVSLSLSYWHTDANYK